MSGNGQSRNVVQQWLKFEKDPSAGLQNPAFQGRYSFSPTTGMHQAEALIADLPLAVERKQWNLQDPLLYKLWIKSVKVLSYRLT